MKKLNNVRLLIIMIVFISGIFGARYAWVQYFSDTEQVEIKDGQLFLTDHILDE